MANGIVLLALGRPRTTRRCGGVRNGEMSTGRGPDAVPHLFKSTGCFGKESLPGQAVVQNLTKPNVNF